MAKEERAVWRLRGKPVPSGLDLAQWKNIEIAGKVYNEFKRYLLGIVSSLTSLISDDYTTVTIRIGKNDVIAVFPLSDWGKPDTPERIKTLAETAAKKYIAGSASQ